MMIELVNVFDQKNAITPEATPNGVETDVDVKDPKDSLNSAKVEEKNDEQSISLESGEKSSGNAKRKFIFIFEKKKHFVVHKICAKAENGFHVCRQ